MESNNTILLGKDHNLKRLYTCAFSRPGGFINWSPRYVISDCRIREAAVRLFKKWFGLTPSTSWGKNGFMAEAWDQRGNRILIEQVNHK